MVEVEEARRRVEKRAIVIARLVPEAEAYEGKTNDGVEKENLDDLPVIPHVARIEKVIVLDVEGKRDGVD